MKQQRGFTLLEIMVALAVFAILSLLAIASFNTILKNRDHINTRLAELGQLQMTAIMLQRDLNQMIDRPTLNSFGSPQPALQASGTIITLTRAGFINPMGALQRSTLQRVQYSMSKNTLIRTTWDTLDQAPTTQSATRIILSNTNDLKFEFIDKLGKAHDSWPPVSTPPSGAADDNAWSQSQPTTQTPTTTPDPNAQKPKWPRFPNGVIVSFKVTGWGQIQFVIPVYAGDLEQIEKQSQQQNETNTTS